MEELFLEMVPLLRLLPRHFRVRGGGGAGGVGVGLRRDRGRWRGAVGAEAAVGAGVDALCRAAALVELGRRERHQPVEAGTYLVVPVALRFWKRGGNPWSLNLAREKFFSREAGDSRAKKK